MSQTIATKSHQTPEVFGDDPIPVILNWCGEKFFIETDQMPEIGSRLNIKRNVQKCCLKSGLYKVTYVNDQCIHNQETCILVSLEPEIKKFSKKAPIYEAYLIS